MMKLNRRNYFSRKANREYLSVSQFKAFEKCPFSAIAEIKGNYERKTTTALLIGSYVDAYFDGTLKSFLRKHPDILKKDGTLKAEFVQANAIIKRIERDKLFMDYTSGKKQVIMTGEISGVPVKIMIDSLHPDKIVDRKIMRDFESARGGIPWFEAWGYDLQGAVYQEIVRQNTGARLPFYLAGATKESVCNLDIVHMGQKYLDLALERFADSLPRYHAMKQGIIEPERCDECDYCKETKVLTEPREAEEFYLLF